MRAESPDDLRPNSASDLTEGALAYRAAQIAEVFKGRLPSTKELKDLTEELGVELATAVFLRTAQEASGHGPFAREVRAFDLDSLENLKTYANQFEVLFIGSNLPQSG